jgi:hypothetical protein
MKNENAESSINKWKDAYDYTMSHSEPEEYDSWYDWFQQTLKEPCGFCNEYKQCFYCPLVGIHCSDKLYDYPGATFWLINDACSQDDINEIRRLVKVMYDAVVDKAKW